MRAKFHGEILLLDETINGIKKEFGVKVCFFRFYAG